jgi:hypothetical protein
VPSFSAGGSNQTLSGTSSLAPGTYGQLTLNPLAVVTLTGGTYNFTSIDIKALAKLRAAAATTIRVSGRVQLSGATELRPAPGGAVQPHDIVLYATGQDAPPNADAIVIGASAIVGFNAYAPNGTVTIGPNTNATGAFVGKRVKTASNVTLAEDSAFVQP